MSQYKQPRVLSRIIGCILFGVALGVIIYMIGAFILWDIYPDDAITRDAVFKSIRTIMTLSAICAIVFEFAARGE